MPEVESPHHGQYDDVAEDGHGVHLLPEIVMILYCLVFYQFNQIIFEEIVLPICQA